MQFNSQGNGKAVGLSISTSEYSNTRMKYCPQRLTKNCDIRIM